MRYIRQTLRCQNKNCDSKCITKKRKAEPSLKICKDQTKSEAELQKEIVKRLSIYKDLFIIYNDPVSPAMKFIHDPRMRMAFIQYSKSRGWEKGSTDLIIIWQGKVTFLELKHDGKAKGRLSQEQILYKDRVEKAGYEWVSWRTIDECVEWANNRIKDKNKEE